MQQLVVLADGTDRLVFILRDGSEVLHMRLSAEAATRIAQLLLPKLSEPDHVGAA